MKIILQQWLELIIQSKKWWQYNMQFHLNIIQYTLQEMLFGLHDLLLSYATWRLLGCIWSWEGILSDVLESFSALRTIRCILFSDSDTKLILTAHNMKKSIPDMSLP